MIPPSDTWLDVVSGHGQSPYPPQLVVQLPPRAVWRAEVSVRAYEHP